MRVRLVKKGTIEDFCIGNPQSRASFREWLSKIKIADWETLSDAKKTFSTADILGKGSNRIIFDIGGNHYRMVCHCLFGEHRVHLFISWIGTHAEYDKLCKQGFQYSIKKY